MELHVAFCVAGFLLLYFGAEWLVRGSSNLARSFGISPIVIGLTVVAFGTSAPEFVVSLVSSIGGRSMIAVGNVFGSNICNIALVLGMAALFQPIVCDRMVLRREIPVMLLVTLVAIGFCADSRIERWEGAVLFAGIVAYTLANYLLAMRARRAGRVVVPGAVAGIGRVGSRWNQVLLVVVGIAGVVGGAKLVVDGASEIMKALGVDEKFVGLTIVAIGTSLPELATSVVAAVRKEMDISIGNLVGSNVFNLLSVLGAAALVRPIDIPDGGFVESGMAIDAAFMLGTSALPLFLLLRRNTVSRPGGLLLLLSYAGFLVHLVLNALAA